METLEGLFALFKRFCLEREKYSLLWLLNLTSPVFCNLLSENSLVFSLLKGMAYSLREIFRGIDLRGVVEEGRTRLLFLPRDWYEAFSCKFWKFCTVILS